MTASVNPRLPRARVALLDTRASALLATAGRALCDDTRAQIVYALCAGPLAVTDLTELIGRPRTVVSQHLRVLREAGLVEPRRRSRWLYYSLTNGPAVSVVRAAVEAALDPN